MHLVVGATGRLGGAVVARLLERGDRVRALVRASDPDRDTLRAYPAERLRSLGAELVEGDLTRPDTLAAALDGVRYVLSTASATKRGGADTLTGVDVEGTGALGHAARAAGVRQLVYVSAHLADPASARPVLREKGLAERALAASGAPVTILRPTKFMQDWIGTLVVRQLRESAAAGAARVQLVGAGDVRVSFVDEDDVAALAVAVLGHEDTLGETLPLCTEVEDYRGLVERAGRVHGGPVTLETLPEGGHVTTVPPVLAPTIAMLLASVAASAPDLVTTPQVAARFGLQPSGIDAFLKRALTA